MVLSGAGETSEQGVGNVTNISLLRPAYGCSVTAMRSPWPLVMRDCQLLPVLSSGGEMSGVAGPSGHVVYKPVVQWPGFRLWHMKLLVCHSVGSMGNYGSGVHGMGAVNKGHAQREQSECSCRENVPFIRLVLVLSEADLRQGLEWKYLIYGVKVMSVVRKGTRERKRISEGCTVKSFTTVPDWSLVLWRNSGKWYKTHISEWLHWRGTVLGVFLHLLWRVVSGGCPWGGRYSLLSASSAVPRQYSCPSSEGGGGEGAVPWQEVG